MGKYHEVLGVDSSASMDDIKAAHRKKIMEWHPDRHPDKVEESTRRTQEINEAYDALKNGQSDPEMPHGNMWNRQNSNDSIFTFTSGGFGGFDGIEEIFRRFHGMNTGRSVEHDINQNIEIPIKSMIDGISIFVQIRIPIVKGNIFEYNIEKRKIVIPPNTKVGTVISYPGKGANINGVVGDFNVTVYAKSNNDEGYVVDNKNNNIIMMFNLDAITAAIGGSVTINLPTRSSVKVNIPAGTQNNRKIRLKNKGLIDVNNRQGDLILVSNLIVPNLSDTVKSKIRSVLSI